MVHERVMAEQLFLDLVPKLGRMKADIVRHMRALPKFTVQLAKLIAISKMSFYVILSESLMAILGNKQNVVSATTDSWFDPTLHLSMSCRF